MIHSGPLQADPSCDPVNRGKSQVHEVGLPSGWTETFSVAEFFWSLTPALPSVPIMFSTKCIEHKCCVKMPKCLTKSRNDHVVWDWFSSPPTPVLAKQMIVLALCQKWHSWVTKRMVPQKESCNIYLGKVLPASDSPLPATGANLVPSLRNTELSVCKAILETEAKSSK